MGRMNNQIRIGSAVGTGWAGTLVLVGVALTLACQAPRVAQVATAEEKNAYYEALSPLPQDPAGAQQRLEAFLESNPQSPLADDVGEKLAAIELGRGHRAEAEVWLAWVLREHPNADRTEAARLALAAIALGAAIGLRQLIDGFAMAE